MSGRLKNTAREVGVIVVGVLIALAADAAYGRLQDRHEADRYRRGFVQDLVRDSTHFSGNLDDRFLPAQKNAVDSLILLVAVDTLVADAATVARLIASSNMLPGGEKTRSTFDEIVAAGHLDLLDATLRGDLTAYYSTPLLPHSAPYEAWLVAVRFPYLKELSLSLGPLRVQEIFRCENGSAGCYERIADDDDLQLLRGSTEIRSLLPGMGLLQYFALEPIAAQAEFLHQELLPTVRGRPASQHH